MEGSNYSPASLRPGGAIAYHLRHDCLSRLLYHGRWHSVKTVQHYLHEGVAATVASSLAPGPAALVARLGGMLPELLNELD